MIMQFKTKRNTYGHRKYLCIDTGSETYTRHDPYIITEGIEIKTSDYNDLLEKLKTTGYREVDRIA